MPTDSRDETTTDRIERSILIDAPAERVWPLASEPGWWINEGEIVPHHLETDGDVTIVHDPVHGAFQFETVELDPPRRAVFRWFNDHGADGTDAAATLVDLRISDRPEGGVELLVVETGFDDLPVDAAERRRRFEDHTEGWPKELDALRRAIAG